MIMILERERRVGSWPYRFQVLAQVVGPSCWLLPKPMYNCHWQTGGSFLPSFFFFHLSLFFEKYIYNQKNKCIFFPPFHEAVAGITERSMVSINDPIGVWPTIPSITTVHSVGHLIEWLGLLFRILHSHTFMPFLWI